MLGTGKVFEWVWNALDVEPRRWCILWTKGMVDWQLKGQMNQNLDILFFSHFKATKLNILRKLMRKSTKTVDGFTKTFLKWPRSSMEGMELRLLCDVIFVLNISAFRRQWVLRGKGFGSKYKPSFTCEMAEEFARFWESIIRLFFVVCLSNCGLATFHREVRNRRYRVFFGCKSMRLKKES